MRIDPFVYDIARIIRLPNTRHDTGLFKRRIDTDALFQLDIDGIRRHAAHPAGDGLPAGNTCSAELAADWHAAEAETAGTTEARAARRVAGAGAPDARAPRYFMEFLRFATDLGERHTMLFRCAAWLTEQGAPPSLVAALLTEPGCDVALTPTDVGRQIDCGIAHARRQHGMAADPTAAPDDCRPSSPEDDPLPPGALDFPFGANDGPYGNAGGRR